ncbi:MAG TPA: LytTR family DNA-binding domain-containing protein [Prolixibacteraceae bacterium]
MIKAIIIDDDVLHLQSLAELLNEHFKQVEIIATCNNVPDSVKIIDGLKPQLVFLDIEMSPYTGFDLLDMVNARDFEVIFTTNYNKYAIQAIRASALDYIEKPIRKENLGDALTRFKEKTGQIKMVNLLANFKLNFEDQKIALYDKCGLNFFEVKKIIRCQSDNAYTEFFIQDDEKINETIRIQVSKGMTCYEDFLIEKGFFFRVHNKHIVNINYIKRYAKEDGGYLIMNDKSKVTVPIARNRKEDFITFLKKKGIIL